MNCWTTKILPELRLYTGDEIRLPGFINNPYTVTEEGLNDSNGDHAAAPSIALVNGTASFEKLPWKPEEGDTYYCYMPDGEIAYSVYHKPFLLHHYNVAYGNCFRTREEARANGDKGLKALGLTEWLK